MGCNCGKRRNQRAQWVHIDPAGKRTAYASLNDVMRAIRTNGGTYQKA